MARESLDFGKSKPATGEADPNLAFGRYMVIHADPATSFSDTAPSIITANNSFESNARIAVGGETTGTGRTVPAYPNEWVRLTRVGDTLTAFIGDNGVDWVMLVERDYSQLGDSTPLPATLYVGPSFSPETGNINDTSQRAKLFLAQIRFTTLSIPFVKSFSSGAAGFSFVIQEATTTVDQSSIQLTLDNNPIAATGVSKSGNLVTIGYTTPTVFPAGSTHSVKLVFKDSAGAQQTVNRSFTVSQYRTLTAADSVPAGSVSTAPSNAGFRVRVHQLPISRGTSIAEAERELANAYIDPVTGLPYDNQAAYTGDGEGYYIDSDVVNSGDQRVQYGNFTDANGYPDEELPDSATGDNIVAEWLTFLDLKKGAYTMGVNSDDGFKVTAGLSARDSFAPSFGAFDGGRGAADTLFDFVVDQDGIYPFRLIWFEGGGDANVEWFIVSGSGEKILLNDLTKAGTVKAYAAATGQVYGAYVSRLDPYPGTTGVAVNAPITAEITGGRTDVANGSAKLLVDGNQVSAITTKVGNVTKITYAPTANWNLASSHNVTLIYDETTTPTATSHTNKYAFSVTLGNESFDVEAEDFDHDKGQHETIADTMPYAGGAYDGLGAIHDIDYHATDTGSFTQAATDEYPNGAPDGYTYRTGIPAQQNGPSRYVPMYSNTGQATDTERPGFELAQNYSIGWSGGGDWYNYTRAIPEKNYKIFGGFSYGDTAADRLVADVGVVTAGVGTSNQTVVALGRFDAAGTGGWGTIGVIPLLGGDGQPVVVHLGGPSATTIRVNVGSGDYDYFFLVPTTDPAAAPSVTSVSPATGSTLLSASSIKLTITDQFRQPVSQSAVKLTVDGTDVTPRLRSPGPAPVLILVIRPLADLRSALMLTR